MTRRRAPVFYLTIRPFWDFVLTTPAVSINVSILYATASVANIEKIVLRCAIIDRSI